MRCTLGVETFAKEKNREHKRSRTEQNVNSNSERTSKEKRDIQLVSSALNSSFWQQLVQKLKDGCIKKTNKKLKK